MPIPAPRGTLRTLARTLLLTGAGLLLCAPPAQAQRMVTYTDADGVSHTHAEKEAVADSKSIVYRYTDAQGVVHFYAERVDDRDQLMASSAATLNHHGKEAKATAADPPFVRTMMAHPDARKYDQLLSQASGEFGVDAALLKAVMTAESGFNARAVSTKGAVGLMQVLPATAERYGLQGDRRKSLHQKLTDPKINIRLAARYLRDLMAMFPQHAELAIASYNAGEGAVQKYGNKIPPYPETQGYVRLVSRFYQLYRPPSAAELAAGARAARLKVTLPPHTPGAAAPEAPPPQAIAGAASPLNDQHD
ncbi:lytic transglycosylase domain-containing protein [Herbaspirillum sp. LeCh32-8]|uniref:lytic transglycosylase domain-containing protein n=1 Tax=Herbaspirillum sp. LeCh32-8 TaxID=2821356 RepID=UPI001AE37234|nr:lytic transglycosylase domain-containing protein [Herbaspirillum sp. LeCh32-8]MBP0596731.1 lytic transglycosylase domain-containing protein [Herbaspirillum sp. LeCh32-8]